MKTLPKVELHLHLDCSLSYEVVNRIDPSVSRAEYERDFIAPAKCLDLGDYISRAVRGFKLMQTQDQLRWVVEDLFQQLAADKLIYAELRFAPLLHLERGLSPETVVETVERATADCVSATGIEAGVILCTLRHYNAEQSLRTAKLVEQFRGSRVVALDIAGDEARFPIGAHIAAFRYAQEKGLNRTAHAGEARGADSVWETLEHFQPTRIGHGVRSIEDAELVNRLREEHIHLEVCPASNIQTNMYDTYADHPVERLQCAGVPLNINTDCRTITKTSLTDEYERMGKTFRWTSKEFRASNLKAVDAAFTTETIKENLRAKLRS